MDGRACHWQPCLDERGVGVMVKGAQGIGGKKVEGRPWGPVGAVLGPSQRAVGTAPPVTGESDVPAGRCRYWSAGRKDAVNEEVGCRASASDLCSAAWVIDSLAAVVLEGGSAEAEPEILQEYGTASEFVIGAEAEVPDPELTPAVAAAVAAAAVVVATVVVAAVVGVDGLEEPWATGRLIHALSTKRFPGGVRTWCLWTTVAVVWRIDPWRFS